MRQFGVRIPASSANLGSGFDCLGIALGIYLDLEVKIDDSAPPRVELDGVEHADPTHSASAILRGFAAMGWGKSIPGSLVLRSRSDIPRARGLGSSGAAILAGAAAWQMLSESEIDEERLLQVATEVEGHGDNVTPSLYGGFTVLVREDSALVYARIDPPEELRAVVAVPDFEVSTRKAREVLSERIDFDDAVDALGRAAMVTAVMATGELAKLRTALDDSLHEPYRAALVPGLCKVKRAAVEAGAWGASLSGAGPSVLALTNADRSDDVARAMTEAWRQLDISSQALLLDIDRAGLQVVEV